MGIIFYNSSNTGEVSNDKSYAIEVYLKKQYSLLKESSNSSSKDKDVSIGDNTQYKKQDKKAISSINTNNTYQSTDKNHSKINLLIRKNAHAFEYLILSLLVGNLLFTFDFKGRKAVIYILFVCLFYSVTDEFHQIFVPGRTPSVADVLIDFLGAVIGTGLFYLVYYFLNKRDHDRVGDTNDNL